MMRRARGLFLVLGWLLPLSVLAQGGAIIRADFDPVAGKLPDPINFAFDGSTDGTLNIPVADPEDPSAALINSLNKMDGWSTTAPIKATFSNGTNPLTGETISSPIDPATVVAGNTVRLFEVELVNPFETGDRERAFQVIGVVRELVGGVEFDAELLPEDTDGLTVVIRPLAPLEPKTSYMAVLTDGIRALLAGAPAAPDRVYIFSRYRGTDTHPIVREDGTSNFHSLSDDQARFIDQLLPVVLSQEFAATGAGVPLGSIVLSWTFTTQSIGDVLSQTAASAEEEPSSVAATGLDTSDIVPGSPGLADVFVGTIRLPYYLEAPSDTVPDSIILTTQWRGVGGTEVSRYNPVPIPTQDVTVPMLITVPSEASGFSQPPEGWPIVLYQHGVTGDRGQLFGVADTLASVGYAAVSVDMPLHGITDTTNPLYAGDLERTFNVDLAPPEGIDPSGAYFFNTASPVTSRDNFRQVPADLFTITRTIPSIDIDSDGMADFDPSTLVFVAHSFGSMLGSAYLSLDDAANFAIIGMSGGLYSQLLSFSGGFAPLLEAALAQLGILRGTPEYESVLDKYQTMLDTTDIINHTEEAFGARSVLLTEVIAEQPNGSIPDGTVPNFTPGSPIGGTDPLGELMELTRIDSSQSDPDGLRVWTRFLDGDHSSFLRPVPSPATYFEIQGEIASFLASGGTTIEITNTEVVEPQDDQ